MDITTSRLLALASGAVAEGEQEVEDDETGINVARLLEIASLPATGGVSRVVEKDLGILGAFGAGLGAGITEPFRLFGLEPEEVTVDEPGEQVANFLGSLVGLGISFIPFAFGTGLALRGLGLTAKVAGVGGRAQALNNFTRNTVAGAAQFAGGAEEIEEVPGRAATGAVFGAAIEGVFLGWAMRGRRGSVGTAKLLDDGNPITDVPVDPPKLSSEIEISPSPNKTTSQMTVELEGLAAGKDYESIITDLLDEHVETVRLTGLSKEGADNITNYAKENFPSAQRLTRATQAKGVHEVLLHQPFDPAQKLTGTQIAQWRSTGYAAGENLTYANRPYAATGVPVAEGNVQLRDPFSRRSIVFAAPIEEVTRPKTTKLFPKGQVLVRDTLLRDTVRSIDDRVGFVVPTAGRGSARRGFVDVSEFETATSFQEFASQFTDDLASVQAASPEEAVSILAAQRGIPGLRIVDDGVTTRVHVFDQKKVGFVAEPPSVAKTLDEVGPIGGAPEPTLSELGLTVTEAQRALDPTIPRPVSSARTVPQEVPNLGLVLDDAVLGSAGEIQSFVPSWKNAIAAPLREAGIPEKEIIQYLDLYALNTSRRLDALMDPEFQAIKNASEIQFGGCP